ncbi:MAG: [FeFe] hydrogenase, group A [Opitutales bacterium]|nr:[FeFe] hydrogenase, group A [Opitutales bacterium]
MSVTATINGLEVTVPEGTSILEAARQVQVRIPTLCKHQDLFPSSACGLCIVKTGTGKKMPRACATALEEGMDITTHDAELTEVRRATLELILSNHPNACQTCGRNGDCELQDRAGEFGIRQDYLPRRVTDLPCDDSTGSLILDFSKCIKCGRCVQVCQEVQNVWALSFLDRGINTRMAPAGDITLAESPCIRCGQCSAHCPTGAIVENDETATVWEALRDPGKICTVQIAPSVRVALGEAFGLPPGTNLTGKIYSALRRLGFKAIFDTTFAADLTIIEEASEFVARFVEGKGELPLITSCCPAWVDYLEKNFSDLIPLFSTAKSPQQMLGALAKTYYPEKTGLPADQIYQVSIMPCTAKKYELERTEEMQSSGRPDVDVVLTTREFARMIKQSGVDFLNLPDEKADSLLGEYSGAGLIFGNTGGVMEAALRTAFNKVTGENLPPEGINITPVRGLEGIKTATIPVADTKVRVAVAHGLANVENLLLQVREARDQNKPPPWHFIEVMACPGGCIGGGGQPYGVCNEVRQKRMQGLLDTDEKMALRFSHENPEILQVYDEFLGEPLTGKAHELLHTSYQPRPIYQK